MEKKETLTFVVVFFFVVVTKSASGVDDCRPAACSPTGPQVRFPFRIRGRQPSRCGFPGFDLSCNKQNQTLLKLPSSRSYVVKYISYVSQVIDIEPEFCQRERIADFKLTDTPFGFSSVHSYTFFNCSSQNLGSTFQAVRTFAFPCLGSVNHSVIAARTEELAPGDMLSSCNDITTISVPVRLYGDIRKELSLMWFRPFCRSCELDGRTCGLKGDDGETACFGSSSHGMPRSAKYGLSIGIGVPALVCLVGLACYTVGRVRDYNQSHHQRVDLFSIAITPQPPSTTGLDGPTIESYPKTVLDEHCRLPKDDGTCPICLSDYEPKDVVRTIPECNHYYHAGCIDEWLKLNATCPVCRNSPESLSLATPCSSMSSNSSRTTNH